MPRSWKQKGSNRVLISFFFLDIGMPFFDDEEQGDDWERRENDFKLKKWVDETFNEYDKDKNNLLNREELKQILHDKEKRDFDEKYKMRNWFFQTFGLKDAGNESDFVSIDDEIFE